MWSRSGVPWLLCAAGLLACGAGRGLRQEARRGAAAEKTPPAVHRTHEPENSVNPREPQIAVATFGAGCFWCVEAVFERLEGVLDVRSGYMGGSVENPTYEQVCSGRTGHAEVVQVRFDPSRIRYEELLDWFWRSHDPTTLNRQGPDVGTQYRSVIFYHDEAQREAAERSKADAQARFSSPIVTEIAPAGTFWEAENYHQDYYRLNGEAPYCRVMIAPKLKKLGLEKQ